MTIAEFAIARHFQQLLAATRTLTREELLTLNAIGRRVDEYRERPSEKWGPLKCSVMPGGEP